LLTQILPRLPNFITYLLHFREKCVTFDFLIFSHIFTERTFKILIAKCYSGYIFKQLFAYAFAFAFAIVFVFVGLWKVFKTVFLSLCAEYNFWNFFFEHHLLVGFVFETVLQIFNDLLACLWHAETFSRLFFLQKNGKEKNRLVCFYFIVLESR
jgi:hypothetical protein